MIGPGGSWSKGGRADAGSTGKYNDQASFSYIAVIQFDIFAPARVSHLSMLNRTMAF